MANTIKIELLSNPANYEIIYFKVFSIGDTYEKTFYKKIVPAPLSDDQVPRGFNVSETIVNLYHNLVDTETDDMVSFTIDEEVITIVFAEPGSYGFEKLLTFREVDYELTLSVFEVEHLPSVAEFPYKHFAIEIVDTYDNDRVLIEETTQMGSPKIEWNAGDDLYESFMISKLTFNMLVTDGSDAKFKHLFTGDEQRYLVRLFFVNEENEVSLCWRGYLLPDQFKDPYKNGVNFIEFTAVDMIASLKGKSLPPWFFQSRLPIAELIATILKMTGLEQDVLVKPSIVPSGRFDNGWRNINVNLVPYFDGKKYTDVYKILEDVLKAQALTLYSYKGFWWLEGFTRKKDTSGTVLRFDTNGKQQNVIMSFSKKVETQLFERNVPVFTGITPWKEVNIDFAAKGSKSFYSDEVVLNKDIYSTQYFVSGYSPYSNGDYTYKTKYFREWINNTNSDFQMLPLFNNGFKFQYAAHLPSSDYDYTESMALANYFECTEKIFLQAGIKYELEMEFTAGPFSVESSMEDYQRRIDAGDFDMLVPFRMFVGGIEIMSNRPSYSGGDQFRFKVSSAPVGNPFHALTFTLKQEFEITESGFLTFHILVPIIKVDDVGISGPGRHHGKVLKISAVSDYDVSENVIAARPINYTQVLDYTTNISSSIDISIDNLFGIGFPISPEYFHAISRNVNPSDFDGFQTYYPGPVYYHVVLGSWEITKAVFERLFIDQKKDSVYLEKPDGTKLHFISLFGQQAAPSYANRMGYLKGITGKPVLPPGYRTYTDLQPSDVLKYMDVKYAAENYGNRLKWKIIGSSLSFFNETYGYNEALATVLHAIQPEPMYKLEGRVLGLVFPDELINFYFDEENRKFIPTTLALDLSEGKTSVVATEKKFEILNDITYE